MELLTPQQVADILGISDRTIHKLCREGKLGYSQVDAKHRRFTQEHVEAYIRSVSVQVKSSHKASPLVSQSVKTSHQSPKPIDRKSLRREMDKW
jgi:excisionase family DNA binding protein